MYSYINVSLIQDLKDCVTTPCQILAGVTYLRGAHLLPEQCKSLMWANAEQLTLILVSIVRS